MQSYRLVTRSGSIGCNASLKLSWSRHASLTSAISAGVRKAATALKSAEKRRVKEGNLAFWERDDPEKATAAQSAFSDSRRRQIEQQKRLAAWRRDAATQPGPASSEQSQRFKALATAKGILVDAPTAVPYTHAASEFIYGTHAVRSALNAKRRKAHQLYIWCGDSEESGENEDAIRKIVQLAKAVKVPIKRVAGAWERTLSKMADGRPHNGVILEADPIPSTIISTLKPVANTDRVEYEVVEGKEISQASIPRCTSARHPIFLWLDKVKDTGNMGAIIRSSYYLGVEGIILPNHNTAPLNAVTVKSSAGAAEYLPILKIGHENQFIDSCKRNGWKFFAAAARESKSAKSTASSQQSSSLGLKAATVLKHHPVVLMLGSEDEGIRPHLQKEADALVSISPGRNDDVLDSLNVSVAAALLSQRFLNTS